MRISRSWDIVLHHLPFRNASRYEREEYRCSLCSYACTIEKAFQRHLRAHARGTAPETRVSCAVCGADRSSEVDLSRHMRRHRDDRYFCCDICIFRTVQLKKVCKTKREIHLIAQKQLVSDDAKSINGPKILIDAVMTRLKYDSPNFNQIWYPSHVTKMKKILIIFDGGPIILCSYS